MKILVLSKFGQAQVVDAQSVPPVGAKVDLFYRPHPTVVSVVYWPTNETIEHIRFTEAHEIEALILTE